MNKTWIVVILRLLLFAIFQFVFFLPFRIQTDPTGKVSFLSSRCGRLSSHTKTHLDLTDETEQFTYILVISTIFFFLLTNSTKFRRIVSDHQWNLFPNFFLRNLFPIKVRLFVCVFFSLLFELELLTNIAISVNMLRIRANVLRYPEQIQISRKKKMSWKKKRIKIKPIAKTNGFSRAWDYNE